MQFEKHGKEIDSKAVEDVYSRYDAVTSCVQRLLNVLFMKTLPKQRCTDDMVDGAEEYILDLFTETYSDLLDKLPEKQREVFLAIAREGKAKGITSKSFVKRHHLQTASVVTAAVRNLLEKDLITEDKGEYVVYDPFFALWLRREHS